MPGGLDDGRAAIWFNSSGGFFIHRPPAGLFQLTAFLF